MIPLINSLSLPIVADRVLVGILLTVCIFVAGSSGQRRWDRIVRAAGVAAALILCVSSQHRLQAWHWLFVLGLGASLFKPENGLQLLRSVLASIYVCSALSRMAPMAHQGMSAAIVDELLWMIGIKPELIAGRPGELLCHALNIGELAVGLLLLLPNSRRYGSLSAMLLHATLLLALGPLGLGHHTAVLLWNVCFLCLIPVVFSGLVKNSPSLQSGQRWSFRAATLCVWLFPLSGLFGIADNWPAWQLYSTRPETWTLRIKEADIHDLDERIQQYVSEPAPLDDWVVVRLDRWSLAETDSPLYPEDRFQSEVIDRILATLPDDAEFLVDVSEPQRWLWWKRTYRTLKTRAEFESERKRFWLH
ncbi:MAG: hypothetical protein WKF77_20535 [Planctomycetaceae bacterium]